MGLVLSVVLKTGRTDVKRSGDQSREWSTGAPTWELAALLTYRGCGYAVFKIINITYLLDLFIVKLLIGCRKRFVLKSTFYVLAFIIM